MKKRTLTVLTLAAITLFAVNAWAQSAKDILQKNTCMTCHSVDGSKKIGPTFKGLFNKDVTLKSGDTVKADAAYLAESIKNPQAKIVKGYNPIMPPNKLTDEEVNTVVEYIKGL